MPITSNNTSAGDRTTFIVIGVGHGFHTDAEGSCLKLGPDKFKRLSDGAVFTGVDENMACVRIADSEFANITFGPGQTFGSYLDGGWFIHFTDGRCVKLEGDAYKRLSDGAIFNGTDLNMEIVPRSEGDVGGNVEA